mmetsp:Transcript_42473/g.110550  ORF Transcript_42473/g.110550 Transcript_42473/m.110550 type:complete len:203 (-) Transcript_42473:170-778(-)
MLVQTHLLRMHQQPRQAAAKPGGHAGTKADPGDPPAQDLFHGCRQAPQVHAHAPAGDGGGEAQEAELGPRGPQPTGGLDETLHLAGPRAHAHPREGAEDAQQVRRHRGPLAGRSPLPVAAVGRLVRPPHDGLRRDVEQAHLLGPELLCVPGEQVERGDEAHVFGHGLDADGLALGLLLQVVIAHELVPAAGDGLESRGTVSH